MLHVHAFDKLLLKSTPTHIEIDHQLMPLQYFHTKTTENPNKILLPVSYETYVLAMFAAV